MRNDAGFLNRAFSGLMVIAKQLKCKRIQAVTHEISGTIRTVKKLPKLHLSISRYHQM
jgi:RNase P/RNase MRP subunit POP5